MRMQRLWQHLLFLLIYGAILPWSSEAVGEGNPRVNKAGLQLTDAALECVRKARSALATAGTEPFPTRSWGPNIALCARYRVLPRDGSVRTTKL